MCAMTYAHRMRAHTPHELYLPRLHERHRRRRAS